VKGPLTPGPAQGSPLIIPAHGTLILTPFGDDLVLQQRSPWSSKPPCRSR
jgi:hypothetical protein